MKSKLFIFIAILCSSLAFSQPQNSFFVIHCDPGYSHLFGKLTEMVDTATAMGVPLTIEMTPQWVNSILASPTKKVKVKQWIGAGHEIAGHHHGIYHCFFDSLTNYPIDSVNKNQPYAPACTKGDFKGTMPAFWDSLKSLAGDSLLMTIGFSDDHPAVDWLAGTPYRTDGGRETYMAFSNPYNMTHGPTTTGGKTYGPYTTCQIDYCFIDEKIDTVQKIIDKYNNTAFSSAYSTVGVVTHVFDYNGAPSFYYKWMNFIKGKGNQTVRSILRQNACTTASVDNPIWANPSVAFPNPSSNVIRLSNLSNKDGAHSVDILNSMGQNVLSSVLKSGNIDLNISTLVPGIYFVHIQSAGGKIYQTKFIKN